MKIIAKLEFNTQYLWHAPCSRECKEKRNSMKRILIGLFCAPLFITGFCTLSHADSLTVVMKPEAAFTPKGFDSKDNVQIVLYGKYHDICHKLAPAKITVDRVNYKIYIVDQAYTQSMCEMMFVTVPYTSVLNLGALPKGNYQVYATDDSGHTLLNSDLPVAAAKSPDAGDDYPYAKVDDAQVARTSDPSVLQLNLKGTLNNTCLSIKEVRVALTAGNVYDVLPIMNKASANCQESNTAFETSALLPNFPSAPTLLNIRTLGGQSIEKVVDFGSLVQ